MRSLYLSTILLFTLFSVALALKPQTRTIEARTLCYARSGEVSKIMIQGTKKKKSVTINLPKESISRRFKCVTINNQAIFYKEGIPDKDGKPVRIPMGVAKVPSGQTKVIFYFIPDKPGAKIPYKVITFSDDYSDFPLGYTRVINLNKTPSRFTIGEHVAVVKPGHMKIFPMVKKRDNFNMGIFSYEQMNKAKKWITIRDRTAKYTTRKRLLIIACHNERLKRPDVRVYKDLPEVEPEATAEAALE